MLTSDGTRGWGEAPGTNDRLKGEFTSNDPISRLRPPIRSFKDSSRDISKKIDPYQSVDISPEEIIPLNIDIVTIASGKPTINIHHPRTLIIEGGTPVINVYCDGSTIVLRGGTPDIRCYNDVFVNFRLEETDYEMSL